MPKNKQESSESGSEEDSKEDSVEQSKSASASESGSDSDASSESEPETKSKRKPPTKGAAPPKTRKAAATKKKKDPNAPKRPMSAYLIFTQENRPAIKAELEKNGEKIKVTDVLKALGAKWKTLTPQDKVPYDKKAKTDKDRFEKEKKTYVPQDDSSSDSDSSDGKSKKRKGGGKAATKKKRKKDPDAPKKPMTAYLLYANDQREKIKAELAKSNPEGEKTKVTEIMKSIGARWKKETPEVKEKFDKLAASAKAQYQVQVDAYNTSKKNENDDSD